jgi:hypothetical protein
LRNPITNTRGLRLAAGVEIKLRRSTVGPVVVAIDGRVTMIRIGIHDEEESTIFTIEGKLTMPSAIELEQSWREAKARRPLKSYVVRLAAVAFIDSESQELLIRMRHQGVTLVPTGCLMKAIVEHIEAQITKEQLPSQAPS